MIYFCTEKFLKDYGMITANVDVTDFTPLVQFASKAYIKPMLGSYFFDDLLAKYNNQTLSADEIILVEKIKFAISWRATADSVVSLTYQLKNKGIQVQAGENSNAPDEATIWKLYDHYIQKAYFFQSEITSYLKLNKALYPVFLNSLNNDSTIKDSYCGDNGDDFAEGVGIFLI